MSDTPTHKYRSRWVATALGALALGGLSASPALADEHEAECFASAATLSEARNAYADECSLPRIDCDPIDDMWFCSSRVIGERAPGSTTAKQVGQSSIGDEPTDPTPTTEAPVTTTTEAPETTTTTEAPETTTTTTGAPETTTTTVPPLPSSELTTVTFPTTDGPNRNPMKGWNSGWWEDRPETTVGFQYVAWKDFEPQEGVFDYSAVEDVINRPGSEGRHVTLRLYCDWHGAEEASRGCPDWMYSQIGVDRLQGDNGRYITDYNDPRYIQQATEAIEALAARYDNDPRLYTIQLGILGYWGEWHTFESSFGGQSYEITAETRTAILDAYEEAFDRVELVARYPWETTFDGVEIGFHNDFFRPDNGHSASFDEAVNAGQRSLDGPIGGEVPPGLSNGDYNALYQTPQGLDMIETGGYSTMKPGEVSSANMDEHLELHQRFGYQFQIDQAEFATSSTSGEAAPIELTMRNSGIAPFYYDWDVQFALIDEGGNVVATAEPASDIRTIDPGQTATITGNAPTGNLDAGNYDVAVRIIQPGADNANANGWGLDARNTYILFANDVEVVDGSWGASGQLTGGWSVLGSTQVTN